MMVQQQWRPENDRAVAAGAVGAHHEQWCVGTNRGYARFSSNLTGNSSKVNSSLFGRVHQRHSSAPGRPRPTTAPSMDEDVVDRLTLLKQQLEDDVIELEEYKELRKTIVAAERRRIEESFTLPAHAAAQNTAHAVNGGVVRPYPSLVNSISYIDPRMTEFVPYAGQPAAGGAAKSAVAANGSLDQKAKKVAERKRSSFGHQLQGLRILP